MLARFYQCRLSCGTVRFLHTFEMVSWLVLDSFRQKPLTAAVSKCFSIAFILKASQAQPMLPWLFVIFVLFFVCCKWNVVIQWLAIVCCEQTEIFKLFYIHGSQVSKYVQNYFVCLSNNNILAICNSFCYLPILIVYGHMKDSYSEFW